MNNEKADFSSVATLYQKARPSVPVEIIKFLKEKIPSNQKAWDCGTGNGQTAIKLTEFINEIHATDISSAQLAKAFKHNNIKYFKADEANSMFADQCVDLITVSQAAHWFDMTKFEKECLRILKPNGIIAIWAYHHNITVNAKVEIIYQELYKTIRPYFPQGREHIDNFYKDININLTKLDAPEFKQTKQMNFDSFIEYLKSFSAYAEYLKNHSKCPIIELGFYHKFKESWGDTTKVYTVIWPIIFKCYIKN
ncbi:MULTISPECIES: class I SAM-dependent methyltransferase [Francisella]|uniref:Class I SAM-dependent methyltransferase n=1 Tax=Francisella opportunistica TaxID=2016517 RepID=A0A345JQV3_9GAMM|nr:MULTISPECIES: class I SAM-dependent methyltransferase [Francisella]APC91408.1 SAM-dependent methyltransferase [Francisella sp. MA067296]AXH29699.1 class I SAM-dependent methyltransferase [Francisella opportunistica]AXH31349.1 class I SAM-dependent methyltransferase [Francisella opportunistica]AXH33984.1 class I SAM-dependent methyltransferase [Francisella opportunistica]